MTAAGWFARTKRRQLPFLAVTALAWVCLWLMYLQHSRGGLSAAHHAAQGLDDVVLMVLMWWGMAIAMMLPTALPALETLESLTETAAQKQLSVGRPMYFVFGFLAVWFGYGLLAAMLQWVLHLQLLINAHAESISAELNAALFLLAGLYQWTPWKEACVSRCRSPMTFFMTHWQEGNAGYWRMGNRMGIFCLGCCWAMMLLMFALGVMNLLWMGLLTLYMYAEKNWISTPWFDRASGAVLMVIGVAMLATGANSWANNFEFNF